MSVNHKDKAIYQFVYNEWKLVSQHIVSIFVKTMVCHLSCILYKMKMIHQPLDRV